MSNGSQIGGYKGLLIVALGAGLLITGVLLAFRYSQPLSQAFTLATTHQPERFTELSFNNAGRLPLYAKPNKPQTFSFHLANHEAQTITYRYLALLSIRGNVTVVREGNVALRDAQDIDETVTFVVPTPNVPAEVSVWLLGRTEHIGFGSHS